MGTSKSMYGEVLGQPMNQTEHVKVRPPFPIHRLHAAYNFKDRGGASQLCVGMNHVLRSKRHGSHDGLSSSAAHSSAAHKSKEQNELSIVKI